MKGLSILVFFLIYSNVALSEDHLANQIKEAVILNLKYSEAENVDKVMSTMHSQSPSYLPTKNALPNIFSGYDLHYEMVSFKFIGFDGDLAYARIKQLTTKISGPTFNNNEVDMVQAFRKEAGSWKLWSQMNIAINYVK